jgi:arsenate reductase (thioredoxin)
MAPADTINPAIVAVMAEVGIDLLAAGATPNPSPKPPSGPRTSSSPWAAATHFPGTRYEDWELDDPASKTLAEVRPIRDQINRCVLHLLDDLTNQEGAA